MQPNGRSPRRWILLVLALLTVVLFVFVALYVWPDSRVVVSPETTHLTEPLDEEGYVDYIEAVNQRGSEGVTPENNAAVLYWQALGPRPIVEGHREEFFRHLGIDRLPEEGDYFESLFAYQKRLDEEEDEAALGDLSANQWDGVSHRRDQRFERRDAMGHTRWVRDDDPIAERWLDEQRQSIDLFVAGTRRGRHYLPLMAPLREPSDDEDTLGPLIEAGWYSHMYRGMARALSVRSMFRLGMGRSDESWQDALAGLRLARHVADGPGIVGALVSYAMLAATVQGIPTILHEGQFTADQLRLMRQQFNSTATCAPMMPRIDRDERLISLDTVQHFSRNRRGWRGSIDWNEVMRQFNRWYDEAVAEMKREAAGQPGASLDAVTLDRQLAYKEEKLLLTLAYPFSRQARTRRTTYMLEQMLHPSISTLVSAERRCKARLDRLDIAFALALHRTRHGRYPPNLAAIQPADLKEIPLDLMDHQPIRYRSEGNGYVLWSIGSNGIDDGGRNWDDGEADGLNGWDDERYRVPRRLKPLTKFVKGTSDDDTDED